MFYVFGLLSAYFRGLIYRSYCLLKHTWNWRGSYEFILPYATYSPWRTDAEFQKVYWKVVTYTMCDVYRCWDLWTLIEQTAKLKGSFIEIGVWNGGSGALIAQRAQQLGISDPVYLCDTFTGVVKAGKKDATYVGGEHADTDPKYVRSLLDHFQAKNARILTGIFPDDTGKSVGDDRFRFCHIDVDVYDSAKDIVDYLWDRLVVGGMMVYDDYGFITCDGITKFVDEQRKMPDRHVIHNVGGHAIVIKLS